ncbi:HalOD1 output domain-containing protein [Halosimplex salinum]|uniref:HalOD1 output domain-containing protein n=1 Tax=Halosimplex salinum TaxID=1710538 RepID=UPI000F499674|nr:HalOD1 output domain-containing protein [Halosimplex salinum]
MNQVQTDDSGDGTICQNVVESIAKAEGTSPTELVPSLYEVIDPDALESLFTDDQALGKVIFNYNGYEVSIFSDGYVSVESHGA